MTTASNQRRRWRATKNTLLIARPPPPVPLPSTWISSRSPRRAPRLQLDLQKVQEAVSSLAASPRSFADTKKMPSTRRAGSCWQEAAASFLAASAHCFAHTKKMPSPRRARSRPIPAAVCRRNRTAATLPLMKMAMKMTELPKKEHAEAFSKPRCSGSVPTGPP